MSIKFPRRLVISELQNENHIIVASFLRKRIKNEAWPELAIAGPLFTNDSYTWARNQQNVQAFSASDQPHWIWSDLRATSDTKNRPDQPSLSDAQFFKNCQSTSTIARRYVYCISHKSISRMVSLPCHQLPLSYANLLFAILLSCVRSHDALYIREIKKTPWKIFSCDAPALIRKISMTSQAQFKPNIKIVLCTSRNCGNRKWSFHDTVVTLSMASSVKLVSS